MNKRIHAIAGCPTLGATDCIGLAVKRSASGADEPLTAVTAASDQPAGVVRAVADDDETLDVALPNADEPVLVRLAAACEELDYLFITAAGKFQPAATGVRMAQAADGGVAGALVPAYLLPPVTIA